MSDGNPVTGHPYGGRDARPDDDTLPGERPPTDEEKTQEAPASRNRDDETASRAAEDGEMTSGEAGLTQPSPGIPEQVDAPSPADATDGQPPGGSARNQRGRAPGQ